MPQFGYQRTIWVYLPPDYATTTKHYPVLYMQDGQNLFVDSASFAGEWRLDETLDSLFVIGDGGCIVIGIENGGERRMAEYMPNTHHKYGGGEGAKYVAFIINTLKPYVDSVYRTKPEAAFTAIGGSSLGGLISYYGATHHNDVFGNALIFSPSFWVDTTYTSWMRKGSPFCVFVAGSSEDDGDVMDKIISMKSTMFALGHKAVFSFPADGEHREWFWSREFPRAYQALFKTKNHF